VRFVTGALGWRRRGFASIAIPAIALVIGINATLHSASGASQSRDFARFVDTYLDDFARRHPSIAAGNGIHAHDDRMDDSSARGIRDEIAALRRDQTRLASFTPAALTAERALGGTSVRVVIHHVLPGVVPTAAVAMTLAVGRGILLESALSFFGVVVQPPTASWGNMLYQAQTTMSSEPWLGVFRGAFIFATVSCCNVLGNAIADRANAAHVQPLFESGVGADARARVSS